MYDFDGDGRLEILALAPRTLFIFDAVTGAQNWVLPENAFSDRPTVSISRIIVADFNGDDIDDLYVVDGGCADAGSGIGLLVEFSSGAGRVLQRIQGNRRNGRCGRWQTAQTSMAMASMKSW